MGYIHTDDLQYIFDAYDVKISAKAIAAISNMASNGQLFYWMDVDKDLPENNGNVIVLAELEMEDGTKKAIMSGAYYNKKIGWILEYHINETAFDIKKWTKLPK